MAGCGPLQTNLWTIKLLRVFIFEHNLGSEFMASRFDLTRPVIV